MLYNSKQLYVTILKFSRKSLMEVNITQKNLLANTKHNLPDVPINIPLLDLLALQCTSVHQLLGVLHTLNISYIII